MIIRAVSDDEDDGGSPHPLAPSRTAGPVHAAQLAWLVGSLALVTLLLADLAAVMSHFQRGQTPGAAAATQMPARDAFALVPALMDAWLSANSSSVVGVLFTAPATALNNLVGYIGVAAWIYSREANARPGPRARSLWLVLAGVACFGHVVSCAYLLAALYESNGDRRRFFLGTAARTGRTYPRV